MEFKIKEAREKANLTQTELAERIGVAPNTFCGYENGRHDPKSKLLIKIAAECGTTVDFLLGLEETKKSPAPEGTEDKSSISMERSNRLYDALIAAGLIVDDNLAPEDMKFLMHIVDVIEDWFARKQAQ